jgi:signal transduction histidine kinase
VIAIGFSAVAIYRIAMEKAATERADDLRDFYRSRLIQLEREWEIQTRDFRVRIEYTRQLEEPQTAVLNLQAFMTLQGGDRRFKFLLIENRSGETQFHFGKGITPEGLKGRLVEVSRYFLDEDKGRLYRVFQEPIWLGAQGMGRMWAFFQIDNALLGQLASPGVDLTANHHGNAVASSLGLSALDRAADVPDGEQRTISWSGDKKDPVQNTIRAPVKVLFTQAELALAAGVIPVLDGLILWFTLGTWLMRQTRRINALDEAVRDASDEAADNEVMERKLREAGAGLHDEIDAVADTIRRTKASRKSAERHIIELNHDLKRQNSQLERVNSDLESFIYSVSHDLRAPLRSISGYSAILLEDYAARIDDAGSDYLSRISAGAARMSQRMDDLLYLSRISRQEMACDKVDLSAMAANIVAELRESDPDRSVEVVIAEAIIAQADPRLMLVALSNLIGNAWKFTQQTPSPRIEIGTIERYKRTIYWVRDNGAGFDQAFAERMFLPFHRCHSDVEFEGTGLGLAIVERVIRRHDGKVWAKGVVDRGATINFTLHCPCGL